MDVVYPSKAAGGPVLFQPDQAGELRVGFVGDEDEFVEIDSDDEEPQIDVRNDAVSGGGARTGAKSMAGSSLAPPEVSSASSHGRRETSSVGRSSLYNVAGTGPSSPRDSETLLTKAESLIHKELRTQMSVSARKQGQSKSVELNEARDAQMNSKRKAEPSTSATPVKRAKVDSTGEEKLVSQRGDLRKENFEEEEAAAVAVREKRHRKLVLGDDTDDEDPQCTGRNREADAVRKNLAKVSPKKGSGLAAGSGKEVIEEQPLSLPGENEVVPFRSAFPLHARKKTYPPVSGYNKSPAGSRFHEGRTTWVTCVKCKKVRKVNADMKLKRTTWCCEENTPDPKYASCSAPQEQNGYRKAVKVLADDPEVVPEREARTKGKVTLSQSKDTVKDKDVARRNTVWVKLQVDGRELYWPGVQVTDTDIQKCDSATQKKYAKGIQGFSGQIRLVRLFHPREDVDEVQVVKRSSVKPFQQARLIYMHSSSHPDFVAAVTAADEYYVEPYTSMDMFSQPASGSNADATGEGAGCHVVDLPHEEAESNEPDSEGPETPGDDPQGSLPQSDNEMEILEDGEVNQVPVKEDVTPEAESGSDSRDKLGDEAGNGSGSSDKGQSSLDKDEDIIQLPIEQGKVESPSDDPPATGEREADKGQEGEEGFQGSVEPMEDVALPEPGDMVTSVDKIGDPPLQAEVVPKFELGDEAVEARERAKSSDVSGLEELYGSGEKIVFDLEVAPTRRLIGYDGITKMLLFQDGSAVCIDPDSLGKELGKRSTGRTLHECIHEVGKGAIREKFPKSARSSDGLRFNALDPTTPFSKRLRDTWLREFGDEPMPEFLKTRFVAGCIMEARPTPVNWAHELNRVIKQELKEVSAKSRNSLSSVVVKPILQLLKKGEKPILQLLEKGESYNSYCQRCKYGGELLCCDGKDCRKTYHLKCLNPPLEEIPLEAFICPSCSAEASEPIGVKMPYSSVGTNLPASNVTREGPQVVVSNLPKGADHQLPNSGTALAAVNDPNIVVDLGVSKAVADASISEKSQIGNTPRVVVDTLPTESIVHHHKIPEPSISVDLRAYPSGPRSNDLGEVGGVIKNVHMGSTPQVTEDGPLVEQRGNSIELEIEEGECSDQAIAVGKTAGVPVSKLVLSSPPVMVSSGVEPPLGEEEFPSSDDHNSICEGCEGGGELMYVTTSSLTPTLSSPLLLCDGKGCKAVYHKECLNPPLETVPVGEWYCPRCEKGKVEKIWSVRLARTDTKSSDVQGDPRNIEDAHVDLLLDARFGQHPLQVNEADKASGSRPNELTKRGSVEYLVQWQSRSHAHDTWVLDKELEKLASKELARFKKLLHDGQLYKAQERYNPEWGEPERVIQKRLAEATAQRRPDSDNSTAEIEWFVKWKGLGYEHCTWESAAAGVLATPRGTELINEFESWKNAAKQRASKESQEEAEKRVKLPMKDLGTQPDWMVRPELLLLQLNALNGLRRLWHARMNGILVYEASQEKIVMTIMFFLSLMEEYRVVRPVLVVVPRVLIQNWELELNQWASKLYIVNYSSVKEEARATIRRTEFNSFSGAFKPQIVLSTFDVINADMEYVKKVEWEALIVDEGRRQRVQKSNQSSYRAFSQIRSTFRLLLLSEPLKSNLEELLQFVNFLGKSVVPHGDDMTQVAELQKRLTGRVLEYIPENRLTEYWVPVEMTSTQLDQYYSVLVKHYPALSRNHRDHRELQNVVTKLRQSCNHPLLLRPKLTQKAASTNTNVLDFHIDISGKLRLVHLIMPILKAANWRILIFSQEPLQLDILERYMTQSHGNDSYERVDSDLGTKGKEVAIQRFNAEGSKRFVLLLKTGVHISFKNVQFLLLYDSDWNPANDIRALHQIHNEGEASSKPLPVIRLYTHLTVEESCLILYRDKQLPPTRANVSAKTCQKLLTWGASRIFDRYDQDKGRRRGAKAASKAKPKQLLYNAEVVKTLLEAVLCQEEGQKLEGHELLEAVIVPRDEPAKLFAEGDHPTTMEISDPTAFWTSSLKWRHEEWQSKEANTLGKGQRGKKRPGMSYDENAMATAAFNKAQLKESERKRPRRRKASSEEQEVVTGPSAHVPTGSIPSSTGLAQDTSEQPRGATEQQEYTDARVLPQLESSGPSQGSAQGLANHDHGSHRNAAPGVAGEPPNAAPAVARGPPKVAPPVAREPPNASPPVAREPPNAAPAVARKYPKVALPVAREPPKAAPAVAGEPPKAAAPAVAREPPKVAPPVAREPPNASPPVGREPPKATPAVAREPRKAAAPAVAGEPRKAAAPAVAGEPRKAAAPAVAGEPPKAAAPAVAGEPRKAAAPAVAGEPRKAAAASVAREPPKAAAPAVVREPRKAAAPAVAREPPKAAAPAVAGEPPKTAPAVAHEPPNAASPEVAREPPNTAATEVAREAPRSNIDEFWNCLPTICAALDLPKSVMERVEALLKLFTQFPKNTRKARATYEIVAIELAVVWLAAKQLNHNIDKMECIRKVERKLGTRFDNCPQLVGPLYSRVVELLSSFQPPVTPPVATQAPESSSPGASLPDHPPRADIEPSSQSFSVLASAGGQPVPEIAQETVQPVVAEALPAPLSVQGTTTEAPESQVASVEVDAEVVFVGDDPRVVPQEFLIDQSRSADPDPSGILVSGASVVEQGKGWVLVDPAPDMLVGERAPVVDAVATPVVLPSSTISSQRGREAVSAAVPGVRTSEAPTSSPLTPTQVPAAQSVDPGRENELSAIEARLKEEYSRDMALIIAAQRKESALFKDLRNQKLEELRRKHEASPPDASVVPGRDAPYKSQKQALERQHLSELSNLGARQRSDRDNLRELYTKLTFSARFGEGNTLSNRLAQLEIQTIRAYYNKFSKLTSSPLQGSRSATRTMPPSPSTTAAPQTSTAQATGGSRVATPLAESQQRQNVGRSSPQAIPVTISGQQQQQGRGIMHSNPPQRSHPVRTGVPHIGGQQTGVQPQNGGQQYTGVQRSGVPHAAVQQSGVQHAGVHHTGMQHAGVQHAGVQHSGVQESAGVQQAGAQHAAMQQTGVQQTGVQHSGVLHASVQQYAGVQPHAGVQRHTGVQHAGVQSRAHSQRIIAPGHPSPAPNLQRGGAVASRSLSTPPLAPAAPPAVGHVPRPVAPTTVTQAGNAAGHVYPDVLLKEKEKLNRDLEKSKTAYEAESQRIKAEYDKEAEILHKKYEALLVEQHRSFINKQQQVQQNILKVEWNRQLAEALKQREELATRAAHYAGLSQAAATAQQAPQQIAVRQQPSGVHAAAAQVHASIPRATTNAGNAGPGISSVTMPPPGTFSTRVSIAPAQHPARFGVPAAAPQQESPRYGMPAPPQQQQQQQEAPRYGMPALPSQQQQQQQEATRYGLPVLAPRSEQPRSSSMSGAMAVLAASANAGTSGNHVAAPVPRVQQESIFTAPPEAPTNLAPGAGSPQAPDVVALMPLPSFQDPILSIIRNSVPFLPEENAVVSPPVDFQQTASMGIQGGGSLNPQSGAGNPLLAGVLQTSNAIPGPDLASGARPDELHTFEGVEVLLSSGPEIQEPLLANVGIQEPLVANVGIQEPLVANVGIQEPLVADVGIQEPPVANVGMQESHVASASMPSTLIYLSDSDED